MRQTSRAFAKAASASRNSAPICGRSFRFLRRNRSNRLVLGRDCPRMSGNKAVPWEEQMVVRRRDFLAGSAGVAALAATGGAQAQAKPRVTFISQWSSGSDGAAITGLGKRFEEEGGIWQHSPVPGFTTEMMNKLRADIIAGNPPAASQLKGPEIAVRSEE